MTLNRILVIEDNAEICDVLKECLEAEGYAAVLTSDGAAGLAEARRVPPEMVLLDLTLPGMPGLKVWSELNQGETTKEIPILIISGKWLAPDVLLNLGIDADHCLTKPFNFSDLLGRIQLLIGRSNRQLAQKYGVTL